MREVNVRDYLFLGDTHGDLEFVERAARLAAEHDAELIQLGDFGFIWPKHIMTASLSLALSRAGQYEAKPPVVMRWIDGNHDWHPFLRNHYSATEATEIVPSVIYQPRGSVHEDEDGTRFLFLGGAPSIDKWNRTEGLSWWPEETITEEEYKKALEAKGPIHVLVTHDAPDYPPGYHPLGQPAFREQSRRSMEMVDDLIKWHRPSLHVHGHWHFAYNRMHSNGVTKIVGLGSNHAPYFNESVMLWSRDLTGSLPEVKQET
jgi:hypothetical protein